MKIYLHFNGDPEFTKVIKCEAADDSPSMTVGQALSAFISDYKGKHGEQCLLLHGTQDRVTVQNSKGKVIGLTSSIIQAFRDKDDAYVVLIPEDLPGTAPKLTSNQINPSEIKTTDTSPDDNTKRSGNDAASDPLFKSALNQAESYMQSRNLRAAEAIYQQLLQLCPCDLNILESLVRLWLQAGNTELAVRFAELAAKSCPERSRPFQLLGEAQAMAGEWTEAVQALERSLRACEKAREGNERRREIQLSLARALHAHHTSYLENDCEDDASFEAGAANPKELQQRCVDIIMGLVAQDESDWETLFMYATLALEKGLLEDAIKVVLRLLVQRSSDVKAKDLLSQCLLLPQGMGVLMAQLGSGGRSAAALAFLANCVKDHGAVAASIELFRNAVEMEPTSCSYSLNYIHALELDLKYDIILQEVCRLCTLDGLSLGGELTSLKALVSSMGDLPILGSMTSLSWLLSSETARQCNKGDGPGPLIELSTRVSDIKVKYESEQLDLLAILFTVVKVAFVGGALALVSQIADSINSARLASEVELHSTSIRNEAAYFGCILRLIKDIPHLSWQDAHKVPRPLYLCGDSHCLSAAWRVIQLRGEDRLLQPLLVTGCKIWHLRPKGTFYPKIQFLNTIRKLPKGSQVVMLFGEIDCREGLLLAVQQCKYETLADGISHTVDIYINLMLELIKEMDLEVFIHPIAPVLKETRPVVVQFMAALGSKITSACKQTSARGKLHFLDFFDSLLTCPPPAGTLKPELEFDGTHLSPHYIEILQSSLNRI